MSHLHRLAVTTALVFGVVACTEEPGGGGVNVELPGSVPGDGAAEAPASATTTTSLPLIHISGRVSDVEGAPVAGAIVTMGDRTARTGPDGWFTLETPSPTGMTVEKPGWTGAELEYDEAVVFHEATISPLTIRGVRVSADVAGDDVAFQGILQLARETAVNSLVFDTKQEGGKVLYDTGVRDAHVIGAVDPLYDPVERIEQARAEGLYTITRVVAFDDGHRAAAFEEERLTGGWLDPASEGARRYVLSLAEEACELGFDEIQFDYIRYPSSATATHTGQLEMTQAERVAVISGFLSEARALLSPMGCAVSGDVFGIVVSVENDQGLGQRPEELSAHLDVFSPMVYPSHYSLGWLGLDDPNAHPYDVTADAISDGLARIADHSRLRPWLQAFWWTNSQIRSSIQAAEDHGVGWMLWNVRSNFDAEAIPADEELGG